MLAYAVVPEAIFAGIPPQDSGFQFCHCRPMQHFGAKVLLEVASGLLAVLVFLPRPNDFARTLPAIARHAERLLILPPLARRGS
jgi:hypothetical protein